MSEKLHAVVCTAVSILNVSVDMARSEEGRQVRDILRQALIDYADDFMDQPVTEQERKLIARKHRLAKRIRRRP